MAGRAEFGDLVGLFVKRLQERVAMRLGVQLHVVVMQESQQWVVALRQFRELRVLKGDSALPHGAIDVHDGMAGHAS